MRVGFNPNKNQTLVKSKFTHLVVMPVYIPKQEGYFKDSFQILQYSLDSLFKTSHSKTYISVVANGCCLEVQNYLDNLLKNNQIQELIITTAIGKINAVLKGIAGHDFPMITVTDADVLFLDDWQNATYAVFENFPKTGAVCTTPSSRSYKTYTGNIYWRYFFSKKLAFTKVINPNALKAFAHSVGNEYFYNQIQLEKYLTISNKDFKAVVGAGHYVTTYRKEIFMKINKLNTDYTLGGSSESDFLDMPVVRQGLWRLSTADNFTYHMGNVKEDWMTDKLLKLNEKSIELTCDLAPIKKGFNWYCFVKEQLFARIIHKKRLRRLLFRLKGLSKREANQYV